MAEEQGIDVWIAPSAPGPAPRGPADTGSPVICRPWSWAGLPALSLPAGLAANGLPLGLQCVGRAGADEQLLCWGVELASALAGLAPNGG